jgi:hypothetical protein
MGWGFPVIQVLVKFHAQVATKMKKGEVLLDFSKNTTWSQLFKTLEEKFGFEFSQNVFTLVNGKSIWSYQSNEELIDTAKVIIEVFPAPVGG